MRSILKNAGSSNDSLPPEDGTYFEIQHIDDELLPKAAEYLSYLQELDQLDPEGPSSNACIVAELRAAVYAAEAGMRKALERTMTKKELRIEVDDFVAWRLEEIEKASGQSTPTKTGEKSEIEEVVQRCKFNDFMSYRVYSPNEEEEEEAPKEIKGENDYALISEMQRYHRASRGNAAGQEHRQPLGVIKEPSVVGPAEEVVNNGAYENQSAAGMVMEIQSSPAIPVTRDWENSPQFRSGSLPPEALIPRHQPSTIVPPGQEEYNEQYPSYPEENHWQPSAEPSDLPSSPPSSPTIYATRGIKDWKNLQAEDSKQREVLKKRMSYERLNWPCVPEPERVTRLPPLKAGKDTFKTPCKKEWRRAFVDTSDDDPVCGMSPNRPEAGSSYAIQTNTPNATQRQTGCDDNVCNEGTGDDADDEQESSFTEYSSEEDGEIEVPIMQNVKRPAFQVWRD